VRILLASRSPRRQELLSRVGLKFDVVPADIDESSGFSDPSEIVCDLSLRKASFVAGKAKSDDIVISADTLVALEGQCLGKPEDAADAARMLRMLSGKSHEVYTGMTVMQNGRADTRFEMTRVRFKALSDGEIEGYLSTGEPMDKAGAYGIQGYGAFFVEGIEGDYLNVMGLPLKTLYEMLKKFGVSLI